MDCLDGKVEPNEKDNLLYPMDTNLINVSRSVCEINVNGNIGSGFLK